MDEAIVMMRKGRAGHFDPQLPDLFFSLKNQMTGIACNFSNPIGDELTVEESLINDIRMLRPE